MAFLKSNRNWLPNCENWLVFIVVITVNFQYSLSNAATIKDLSSAKSCNNMCSSDECKNQADLFFKLMNQNINPCDDFYGFVCGNFINTTVIPDDKNKVNLMSSLNEKVREDLISGIKKKIAPGDSEAIKKLKILYQNCIDEAKIEEQGLKPYLDMINKFGGWPLLLGDSWKEDNYNWMDTFFKINDVGVSPRFPFIFAARTDPLDSEKYILDISPPVIIINDIFEKGSKNYEAYKAYMIDFAMIFGANKDTVVKEVEECLNFETELYKINTEDDKWYDTPEVEKRKSIRKLSEQYPQISWLEIINQILRPSKIVMDENDVVHIWDLKYISNIADLIQKTPKRVLANYQIWRILFDLVYFMSKELTDREFNFRKILKGETKKSPRDLTCMIDAFDNLNIAVSAEYVKKHFDAKTKEIANQLIQEIRQQMKNNLEQAEWMDNATRNAALEKLNKMNSMVAFPDELLDDKVIDEYYKDLKIIPGDYFHSMLNIAKFQKVIGLKNLRSSDDSSWAFQASVAGRVTAYYTEQTNEITLPAGLLQNPFFHLNGPEYLNFGSIGYFIGNLITRTFYGTGKNYDGNGNYKNWWTNNTQEKFNEKSKCLIELYNNYKISQIDEKINGKSALNQNIGFSGGIKLAYHAYAEWLKHKNLEERCLPGMNYTPRQMFWISAASTQCIKIRDENLRLEIKKYNNSPSEARVSITFSNFNEFANDFNCNIGSKMNPVKKCHI